MARQAAAAWLHELHSSGFMATNVPWTYLHVPEITSALSGVGFFMCHLLLILPFVLVFWDTEISDGPCSSCSVLFLWLPITSQ